MTETVGERLDEARAAVADAIRILTAWDAPASHFVLRDEYVALLRRRGAAALDRDGGPQHVTASCLIFTPDLSHVLLCFHKKGQFWVQVGGHVDATDETLSAAALREAHEESGLTGLTVVDGVLDVDRHDLSTAFGRCQAHWDVGFVALSPHVAPTVSEESEQVGWFPVDALPQPLASAVSKRVAVMLAQLG